MNIELQNQTLTLTAASLEEAVALRELVAKYRKKPPALPDHLLQALCAARAGDSITASELASSFDLNLNAASTRLKRLHDVGLLHREAHSTPRGLEYLYRAVESEGDC